MKIFLFRHGNAFPVSKKNTEENRPLTKIGIKETLNLSKFISNKNIQFDYFWSSPFIRAQETAKNILRFHSPINVETLDILIPQSSSDSIIEKIQSKFSDNTILGIVGHQPSLGLIVGKMLGTSADNFKIAPATLIELDILKNIKNNSFNYKLISFIQSKFL